MDSVLDDQSPESVIAGPTTRRDAGRRRFRFTAALFAVVTGAFALWIGVRIGGDRTTTAVDDIGELVAALVAAGACAATVRRLRWSAAGWAVLGASCLAWAAGEAVWCYYELIAGVQVPFPSLADAGFLLAVPLAIAGVMLLPGRSPSTLFLHLAVVDGLLVGGSLFLVSWVTVLGPVYRQHELSIVGHSVSLSYPISDIVVATVVVMAAAGSRGDGRASLGLVLAGMLAFAIADSSFAYFTASNSYGIGNALDTGWVLGYLAIALGALRSLWHPGSTELPASRRSLRSATGSNVPLALAGAVLGWRLATGRSLGTMAIGLAIGLALVMGTRQLLVRRGA